MITDELKRQFGELAVEFSENLERGAHANLEALADQSMARPGGEGSYVSYRTA
jgi:hypothetical protein